MVEVPEYRSAKIAFVVFLISYILGFFPHSFRTGNIAPLLMSISIISGLSAIMYFLYGYRRVRNLLKPSEHILANYFVPHKAKIYASLIVAFVVYVFLLIAAWLISFRSIPIAETGGLGGGIASIFTNALSIGAFSGIFGAVFITTYFLFPFVVYLWNKSVWKKIFKMLFIVLVVVSLLVLYDLNNFGKSLYYMGEGINLIREGKFEKGIVACEKSDTNFIIIDFVPTLGLREGKFIEICETTAAGLKLGGFFKAFGEIEQVLTEEEIDEYVSECEKIMDYYENVSFETDCLRRVRDSAMALERRLNQTQG